MEFNNKMHYWQEKVEKRILNIYGAEQQNELLERESRKSIG